MDDVRVDQSSGEQEPLDLLTEEFLDRRRRGEALDVEAFAEEHPSHGAEIRELFPALLQIEGAQGRAAERAGDRLGRWRVVRELGRGGMGVVYLAADDATGERVALKTLSGEHPEDLARFRREAAAVARLSHPGVCRAVEIAPEGGRPWIAFEYLEGETVAEVLRRERKARAEGRPRSVSPERWTAVGAEVAHALHAAHEAGLVHRDVKPSNVMLAGDRAIVLDFGLAHEDAAGERTRLTHTGVPVGTPAYMSPEQVRAGSAPLDRRTDVYSLGAMLYEALTLEPPFPGPTVAAVFSQILTSDPEPLRRREPSLPRDLEVVLATAMEKRPDRRYASALLFAEDLERVRRRERVRARPPGTLRRIATWAVHRPRAAGAVGALAVALVTGLVVALTFLSQVSEARDREAAAGRRARARALASASAEVRTGDAVLSLLLARRAVAAARSPETLTQLHAAVTGSLERARLEGHEGPVTSIAWDLSGSTVATGCADGRARLFRSDGTPVCVAPRRGVVGRGPIEVALSPSGKSLATRDADGTVRLWRDDGSEVRRLTDAGKPASAAFFLTDGSLAVLGRGGRVTTHDADGNARAAWSVPLGADASSVAIPSAMPARDGPRLHLLTRDHRLLTYDRDGKEVGRVEAAVGSRTARVLEGGRVAFSGKPSESRADAAPAGLRVVGPDGRPEGSLPGPAGPETLLCAGDSWWCAWSPAGGASIVDGGAVHVLDMQRSDPPGALIASPDGSRLFTARTRPTTGGDGTMTDGLRLWVPPAGTLLAPVTSAGDRVEDAEFSLDGRLLALGRHGGGLATVHATTPVELATEAPRWRLGPGYRYPVALTADGRHMVTFADEHTLRVLDDDGSERARWTIAPAGKATTWLSLHPTRGEILVTGPAGEVTVYDLDGTAHLRLPPTPSVRRASWLGADGRFLTTDAAHVRFHAPDGTVVGRVAGRLAPHDSGRGAGDEAPIETEGGTVVVCTPNGDVRRTLPPTKGDNAWYEGSPAGPFVWVGGLRDEEGTAGGLGTCRYFDAEGRKVWEVPVGGVGARQAAISPDGSRVAVPVSGGLDLRDAAGRAVASLRLEGGIVSVAFDGKGTLLAASSMPGVVRVWDRDGHVRFDLPEAGGHCYVGFSDDGRRVATVSSASARLFTTDPDELIELARRRSTRELTEVERARFVEILGESP